MMGEKVMGCVEKKGGKQPSYTPACKEGVEGTSIKWKGIGEIWTVANIPSH